MQGGSESSTGWFDAGVGWPPTHEAMLAGPSTFSVPRIDAIRDDGWLRGSTVVSGRTGTVRWSTDGRWMAGAFDCGLDQTDIPLAIATQLAYQDILRSLCESGVPHLIWLWNYLPGNGRDACATDRHVHFRQGLRHAIGRTQVSGPDRAPGACVLGTGSTALSHPVSCRPARAGVHRWKGPPKSLDEIEGSLLELENRLHHAQRHSSARFELRDMDFTVYLRSAQSVGNARRCFADCVGSSSGESAQADYVQADFPDSGTLVEV